MCAKMYACLVILLCLTEVVHQLEMTASYETSFRCSDGSYALISGDNLTLVYDYGYKYSQLQSFHLYERNHDRHMFDFEAVADQAFIKRNEMRLKHYNWTDTGIKFTIPDIDRGKDLGKYEGEVETGPHYNKISIEVKQIFDPPAKVNIIPPVGEESFNLTKGFNHHVLEASAESYRAITCNSVRIIWVASTKGNISSCQAKDERNATVCPFILNESEMTLGECMILEVHAEQYGVQSEMKVYNVCYYANEDISGDNDKSFLVIAGGVVCGVLVVVVVIIAIVVVVYLRRRGPECENRKYLKASNL